MVAFDPPYHANNKARHTGSAHALRWALGGAMAASALWAAGLYAGGWLARGTNPSPMAAKFLALEEIATTSSHTNVASSDCGTATACSTLAECADCPDADCPESCTTALAGKPRLLHEREDYCVEPPDVLQIKVLSDGPNALSEIANGPRLVSPDGEIDLGAGLGSMHVAGMTLEQINDALESRLGDYFPEPIAQASVISQNSHVFYVITAGTGDDADTVFRMPIATGEETVLDALDQVGGKDELQNKHVWIARPDVKNPSEDQILRVSCQELSTACSSANHRLLPGDRVFVTNEPDAWTQLWLLVQGDPTNSSCCHEKACDGEGCDETYDAEEYDGKACEGDECDGENSKQ